MWELIKRRLCKHPELKFVRGLYGDEIIEMGWKRSVWKCTKCGKIILRSEHGGAL